MSVIAQSPSSLPRRVERLEALLREDPGNTLLLEDLAAAALAAGALEQAEQHIATWRAIEPGSAPARFRLASVRIAQRRLDEAEALLAGLEDERPGQPAVAHDRAYIRFLRGEHDACLALLDSVPYDAAPLQALRLRAWHHTGRLQQAWAWAAPRAQAGRLHPAAAGVAALVALDLKKPADAVHLADLALGADPRQPEALVARACAGLLRNELELARALLDSALEVAPRDPRCWSSLGSLELAAGRLPQARAALQRAATLSPADATLPQALGWVCVLQGDAEAALAAFRQALRVDPEEGDVHAALAVVLAARGEAAAAEAHLAFARRQRGSAVTLRLARAVLDGDPKGLQGVQRLVRAWVAKG